MEKYRHGDVILRKVEDVQGEKQDHLTLAEGEQTGHSHRITAGEAALFKFEDKTYLKIQSDLATLSHQQHGELQLPAGNYEVQIQRQHTPKGWEYVKD